MDDEIRLLYVTAANSHEADTIANTLVTERLAACANLLGPISSVYFWDGQLQKSQEVALILKTRQTLSDAAVARVRALHSYECPAIVVIPVLGGHAEFLDWIRTETGQGKPVCGGE